MWLLSSPCLEGRCCSTVSHCSACPLGALGWGDLGVLRVGTLLSPCLPPSLRLERKRRQSVLEVRYCPPVGSGKGQCLSTCCW